MVSMRTIVVIGVVFVVMAACVAISLTTISPIKSHQVVEEERKARELLSYLRNLSEINSRNEILARWNYEVDITDENKARLLNLPIEFDKEKKDILDKINELDWKNFRDPYLIYQIEESSYRSVRDDLLASILKLIREMKTIYSTTKICDFNNKTRCDLNLDLEISEIFEKSQDPEELKYVWSEWHNKVGRKCKNLFVEYVRLIAKFYAPYSQDNVTAVPWLDMYQEDDAEKEFMDLWLKIKPLYLQLHAYVRKQLFNKYGPDIVNRRGPIPTYLLGNMWAQSWIHLESYTRPYPNKSNRNITSAMLKKNYTVLKIFEMADEFFQSINLTKVPAKFWEKSILTKPDDGREMVCHPSAWDFMDGEDFRIKQCTVVNAENFERVFHEMGHIQYYMQYSHQAIPFRSAPNPGFQEAIGDLITLSATSTKHLRKIGLLEDEDDDYESEINELFKKGASKLAVLPFTFLIDVYRWAIFRGQITPENYNCHYWKLKEAIQGVEPPAGRTEEDLDAVAKLHIAAHVHTMKYFLSHIFEFQFHKAVCIKAGEYEEGNDKKKLSNCDIYQSAEAGNALGDMLKYGSTTSWRFAMKQLTNESKINASSLFEYFEPLKLWLERENNRTGELIGWEKSKIEFCTEEQEAKLQALKSNKSVSWYWLNFLLNPGTN